MRSKIPNKGQISILFNSRRIVPQSEPFEEIISEETVSRSTEVTKGQRSQSKSKKVKFLTFSNVDRSYINMKLLTAAIRKY